MSVAHDRCCEGFRMPAADEGCCALGRTAARILHPSTLI